MAPAVADFIQVLKEWLDSNQVRVAGAYNSGGGWELWLHVELYLAMKARYPRADVVREARDYDTKSLRADLVLNSRCQGATACVVEIKTELMSELYTTVAIALKPNTWRAVRSEVGEKHLIGNVGLYYSHGVTTTTRTDVVGQPGPSNAPGGGCWAGARLLVPGC